MNAAAVITPLTGLDYWARLTPEREALRWESGSLTFAQLAGTVRSCAATLRRLGLARGSTVGMSLRNEPEAVILPFAAALLGARVSPINFRLRARELEPMLALDRLDVLVFGDEMAESVAGATAPARLQALPVAELRAAVARAEADPAAQAGFGSAGDAYTLLWTSGTLGNPRPCRGSLGARMNWISAIAGVYGFSCDDTFLAAMPIMHSAGFTNTLASLYYGSRVVLVEHFAARPVWELMRRERISTGLFVPTMLQMLLDDDPGPSIPSLRAVLQAGARVSRRLHDRILDRFPDRLYTYYGSTESPSMTVLEPAAQAEHPLSVGMPFPGVQIDVRTPRRIEGWAVEAGEIYARNPFAMDGYELPDAASPFDAEGWIDTGDLGYFEGRFLHVIGRASEMIISGGYNVGLPEIERVLAAAPGIADVGVVGVDDPLWGAVPAAALVLAEGEDPQRALDSLRDYCRRQLANFKIPRHLRVVSAIPRNASGKVAVHELRALFALQTQRES